MIATETRYEIDALAARLRPHESEFRKLRATEMSLFIPPNGTEARAKGLLGVLVGSDDDLGMSLFDLFAVGEAVQAKVGLEADVVTRTGLEAWARREIEPTEVRVF